MLVVGTQLTEVSTTSGNVLGNVAETPDGKRYIYAKASSACAQYDVVAIDESFLAVPITKTLADAGNRVGVAGVAFAANEFGWFQIRGICTINVLASCAADVALYTSATAGSLDDTTTSQTKINGIVLTTARGGTNGSALGIATIEPFAV